jgi:very-short-patch-repair endonuclease
MGNRLAPFKSASPDRYLLLREFARKNRKNATLAEQFLWEHLRGGALGVEFLRQHVIGDYIVDFVSRHEGLVIEVDGGYHSEPRQQEDDAIRESDLERMGYHVMRFSNEEVLYDTENVIQQIIEYLEENE